jgi:hypothetical protein
MNAPTLSEIRVTDQVRSYFRNPSHDTVPEGASFNEMMQAAGTVRPCALDDHTFETFVGGAGI